jgi:hypothetical protein
MKPNSDKIDEAVLALLYLTSFTDGEGELAFTRAWKGHDWDALDRLHKKDMISDPKKKANRWCCPRRAGSGLKSCFDGCFAHELQ